MQTVATAKNKTKSIVDNILEQNYFQKMFLTKKLRNQIK